MIFILRFNFFVRCSFNPIGAGAGGQLLKEQSQKSSSKAKIPIFFGFFSRKKDARVIFIAVVQQFGEKSVNIG